MRSYHNSIFYLIINSYGKGGAESANVYLANALAALGKDVHLIILKGSSRPDNMHHNVMLHSFHLDALSARHVSSGKDAAVLKMAGLIEETSIVGSTILSYAVISSLPLANKICSFLEPSKVYYWLHFPVTYSDLKGRNWFRRFYRKLRLKRLYMGRNIICPSFGVLEDFDSLFPEGIYRKAKVIYNPVDLFKIFTLSSDTTSAKVGPNPFFLHAARFVPQKRHDRLIYAYKLFLEKTAAQIDLVCIGDGMLFDENMKLVAELGLNDRVHFLGFQKNPFPFMSKAKALILSSDFEAMGMVLVESLSLGTPCVSTNCPHGPNEILIDDLEQCLTQMNPESLADGMLRVWENPPDVSGYDLSRFDPKVVAQQYIDFLQAG